MGNATAPLPSDKESVLARKTGHLLSTQLKAVDLKAVGSFRLVGTSGKPMGLPRSAVRVLLRVLEEMGNGNAVSVIPVHPELTTQEAADMLNISRPSLIQLLDEGRIAYRKVGTHRRVRLESVVAYKRKADADRKTALTELAAYDQEIGL